MAGESEFENFVAAYLGEDWNIDYASWAEAVDAFATEDPEAASHALTRIDELLEQSEVEINAYMAGLCDYYRPETAFREWLQAVRCRLQTAVGEGA